MGFSGTLAGLFTQILEGPDTVREQAIKFMSAKLAAMTKEALTKDVEEFLVTQCKKVGNLTSSNFPLNKTITGRVRLEIFPPARNQKQDLFHNKIIALLV